MRRSKEGVEGGSSTSRQPGCPPRTSETNAGHHRATRRLCAGSVRASRELPSPQRGTEPHRPLPSARGTPSPDRREAGPRRWLLHTSCTTRRALGSFVPVPRTRWCRGALRRPWVPRTRGTVVYRRFWLSCSWVSALLEREEKVALRVGRKLHVQADVAE